jgi:hypothetical protein
VSDPSVDDALGPPSYRERLIDDTMAALHAYDYDDSSDEVDYVDRRREACHVLARIAPTLIDYGREQIARAMIDDRHVRSWDALAGVLRWREGWRLTTADGQPWWVYNATPGGHIDDHLTISVGQFSEGTGDLPVPYLASSSDPDQDPWMLDLDRLAAALPTLEVAEVAGGEPGAD